MNRGNVQLAVRFLGGLVHCYSVWILIDNYNPFDPNGAVSIIPNTLLLEDLRLYSEILILADHLNPGTHNDDIDSLSGDDKLALQLFEKASDLVMRSGKQLLIFAEDMESNGLISLIISRLRGGLKVTALKTPDLGDRRKTVLEDIAILTGGQLISDKLGMKLQSAMLNMIGRARKVVIDRENTYIVNCAGKKKTIWKAFQENIVSSGGVALLLAKQAAVHISNDIFDVIKVCIVPTVPETLIDQITKSVGVEGSVSVDNIVEDKSSVFSFDAQTEDSVDMIFANGVIDPATEVRTTLEDRSSGLLGTTETMAAELPNESPPPTLGSDGTDGVGF
jgi:chaperonin GroEL